eukprot:356840-Chlamydomonas_euryale.AAC.3
MQIPLHATTIHTRLRTHAAVLQCAPRYPTRIQPSGQERAQPHLRTPQCSLVRIHAHTCAHPSAARGASTPTPAHMPVLLGAHPPPHLRTRQCSSVRKHFADTVGQPSDPMRLNLWSAQQQQSSLCSGSIFPSSVSKDWCSAGQQDGCKDVQRQHTASVVPDMPGAAGRAKGQNQAQGSVTHAQRRKHVPNVKTKRRGT